MARKPKIQLISAIERAAAQDGPHQGMARLLVAARAEGAQSRWPF